MTKRLSKLKVKKAIHDSGGIIDEIARRLGVSWATARSYINKWADVKAIYDDENERVLDMAETTVLESIKSGDTQNAKWLLSRKGKDRGYGDALAIDQKGITKVEIEYIDSQNTTAPTAPSADVDKTESEEV